jgi:hypothetical protein
MQGIVGGLLRDPKERQAAALALLFGVVGALAGSIVFVWGAGDIGLVLTDSVWGHAIALLAPLVLVVILMAARRIERLTAGGILLGSGLVWVLGVSYPFELSKTIVDWSYFGWLDPIAGGAVFLTGLVLATSAIRAKESPESIGLEQPLNTTAIAIAIAAGLLGTLCYVWSTGRDAVMASSEFQFPIGWGLVAGSAIVLLMLREVPRLARGLLFGAGLVSVMGFYTWFLPSDMSQSSLVRFEWFGLFAGASAMVSSLAIETPVPQPVEGEVQLGDSLKRRRILVRLLVAALILAGGALIFLFRLGESMARY